MTSDAVVLEGASVLDADGVVLPGHRLVIAEREHVFVTADPAKLADAQVVDGSAYVVTPGLVDAHAHVFEGVTFMGMPVADMSLPTGVTAVVDAGSAGIDTFEGFLRWVVEPADVKVYAFLNLSRVGLTGTKSVGELEDRRMIDDEGLRDMLQRHPGVARGVKVRVAQKATGDHALDVVERARAIAAPLSLPVLVHLADSAEAPSDVLDLLGPGDIVTHFQSGRRAGLLDGEGRVLTAARAARERGVLFDCGHGGSHFSFPVAAELARQGFWPDLLGTDISRMSFAELRPGLANVLTKWLSLGMALGDAVKASCGTAYRRLLGTQPPGFDDLAVFELSRQSATVTDCDGVTRVAPMSLVPHLTARRGRVAWSSADSVYKSMQPSGRLE